MKRIVALGRRLGLAARGTTTRPADGPLLAAGEYLSRESRFARQRVAAQRIEAESLETPKKGGDADEG